MANSYKNIVITPNTGSSTDDPKIVFSGANTSSNTDVTLRAYPISNGTLSFEGSAGQLFSITNDLTGTIFSVNDISGIPSVEVIDTGLIKLAQYNGNVAIGQSSASYKLDVAGTVNVGSLTASSLNITGTTANTIHYNTGTGTGFITAPSNGTFLYYTTAGGFQWTIATGASVGSANIATYEVVTNATTGTYYPGLYSATSGNLGAYANNAFAFDITNGRLGIGTNSPAAKLEMSSSSSGATSEVLRLSNAGTGTGTQSQIKFYAAGQNYGSISGGYGSAAPQMTFDLPSATPGNYSWQISSSEKMRLDSSNNLTLISGGGFVTTKGGIYPEGSGSVYTTTGYLRFVNGSTETIRIDSSGNMGIGANTPQAKLDILSGSSALTKRGSSSTFAYFQNSNVQDGFVEIASPSTNNIGLLFSKGSSSGNYGLINYLNSTDAMSFYTAASERMRIDSSGNVGIGTSSPVSIFDIRESNRTNSTNIGNLNVYTNDNQSVDIGASIALGGRFSTASTIAPFGSIRGAKENSTNNNYDGYLAFQTIKNSSVLSERMRIDSVGNVGIGNTSPSSFNVQGPPVLVLSGTGASFVLNDTTSSSKWALLGRTGASTNQFRIYDVISSADRFIIDSSGNTGIGTTSPTYKLDVAGTANTGALTVSSLNITGTTANTIHYNTGTGTSFITAPSNGTFLYYTTAGGFSWTAATSASVGTANVANYEVVTNTSTNASYYPGLYPSTTTGSQAAYVSGGLSFNPSTGTLTSTALTTGTASVTNLLWNGSTGTPQGILSPTAESLILFNGSMVLGDGITGDTLAFNIPSTAESNNGTSWSSTTVVADAFKGQNNARWSSNYILPSAGTGLRFTWNNYSYRYWDGLLISGSTQSSSLSAMIEGSTNGTTWTTFLAETTLGSTWPGYCYIRHLGNNNSAFPYLRITLRHVGGANAIYIGNISLPGTYGGITRLFDWDAYRNVTFPANTIINGTLYDALNSAYYLKPSSTSVLSTANVSTLNLSGGSANQIHYQTGTGATSFITAPSNGTFLYYTTAGGFSWQASTAASVGTANNANYLGGFSASYFSPLTLTQSAYDTANSKTYTFKQNTAPSTANTSDIWVNIDTGSVYENFGNTTSPQWAEFGPTGIGGTPGAVVGTTGTFSSNVTISYTPSSITGTGLQISVANTKGGIGYADFLSVTNTSGGATNPNKFFRITQTGAFEIINSAYTSTPFQLLDSGDLIISGNTTFNGISPGYAPNRPAFRVYGANTTNALTTTQNGTGVLNYNNWAVDFNQGSYLNNTTGVFTVPVAGLYQVNMSCRNSGYLSGISQLVVKKNTSIVIMVEFAANSSMNHTGAGTILKLSVGDTLTLQVTGGQVTFDLNDNWAVAYIG